MRQTRPWLTLVSGERHIALETLNGVATVAVAKAMTGVLGERAPLTGCPAKPSTPHPWPFFGRCVRQQLLLGAQPLGVLADARQGNGCLQGGAAQFGAERSTASRRWTAKPPSSAVQMNAAEDPAMNLLRTLMRLNSLSTPGRRHAAGTMPQAG